MNIFDRYTNYQNQHITEFRELLKKVVEQLLIASENIPEEYVLDVFKSDSCRRFYELSEGKETKFYKKGSIFTSFSGLINEENRRPYDDAAACELDKFMETYYPGIECHRNYSFDLYERIVEFNFGFEMKLSDEDFNEYGCLVNSKKDIRPSLELFNHDIAELLQLQDQFSLDDWDDWDEYRCDSYRSKKLDYGAVTIRIPLSNFLNM